MTLTKRSLSTVILVTLVAVVGIVLVAKPARAEVGPPLLTPQASLDAALTCTGNLDNATQTPILLAPGFGVDDWYAFDTTYYRALPNLGYPTCKLALPHHATGDWQEAVEYIVSAVRTMNNRAQRKVSVIGHSQAGMISMWALRFWPDLPGKVEDYVALSTGTRGAEFLQSVGTCTPALLCNPGTWQIVNSSNAIAALNRASAPAGPSYTTVSSNTDLLVTPQPWASSFAGVTQIPVQDVCSGRIVDHVGIVGDAVSYALAMDAITHAGPAGAGRVSQSVCSHGPAADFDGVAWAVVNANWGAHVLLNSNLSPKQTYEPALRSYALTATINENVYYKVISRHSGKGLDVRNASTANGAQIQQWASSQAGTQNQQWRFVSVGGGYYKILVRHSGKALDVFASSSLNGAKVQQWTYLGGQNQQWQVIDIGGTGGGGYYKIVARHSGKVLDVFGGSLLDGTPVQQWQYTGGANQLWKLMAIETIP